jgi:hypothetical protein
LKKGYYERVNTNSSFWGIAIFAQSQPLPAHLRRDGREITKAGLVHPIFKVSSKISPYFRRRRFQKFLRVVSPTPSMRILDVGGLPRAWHGVPIKSQITILNIHPLDDYEGSFLQENQLAVLGDGTQLQFADQSFDFVYSNSVIEHLSTWERQQAFAAEARRVGRGYWIQTPAREFPIEPHYFGPFLHWFSKPIQKRLLRNFTLWGLLGRPDEKLLDEVLAELRLLTYGEVRQLFPGSQIWVERLLGLPKSYTAYALPAMELSSIPSTQTQFDRKALAAVKQAPAPAASPGVCGLAAPRPGSTPAVPGLRG